MWNYVDSSDPTQGNSLFGAVKLLKNADIDKYKYSGYGIGFDLKENCSYPTGRFGKTVIIFEADMSSSVYADKQKNNILGEGPTQRLDNTTLAAEKIYSISFTEHNETFCLSMNYTVANSYLFVNGTETHKFKARESETVANTKHFKRIFSR